MIIVGIFGFEGLGFDDARVACFSAAAGMAGSGFEHGRDGVLSSSERVPWCSYAKSLVSIDAGDK